MVNAQTLNIYAKNWAYDMPIKALSKPLLVNEEVINQSIEMILATPRGSRLFNLNFGSDFSLRLFDNLDVNYLDRMIDDTVKAIQKWEDRIIIIESGVSMVVNTDNNTFLLTIPYIIKERQIKGEFSKIIKQ